MPRGLRRPTRIAPSHRAPTAAFLTLLTLFATAAIPIGCTAPADFAPTDAFNLDRPRSLARAIEGALEAHTIAIGATLAALDQAGLPAGSANIADRAQDVRSTTGVAMRRARAAQQRVDAAAVKADALLTEWRRELRDVSDETAYAAGRDRTRAVETAWQELQAAANARDAALAEALDLANERVIILSQMRGARDAAGTPLPPPPWPAARGEELRRAAGDASDRFSRACDALLAILPSTAR
jgi:hypothetical protein